ncbi:MAG: hypothetical protein CMN28_12270 [Salinisphaeraceae bacterium]|nr:hypothetical protein [Salinisphaeraceae bacterium]
MIRGLAWAVGIGLVSCIALSLLLTPLINELLHAGLEVAPGPDGEAKLAKIYLLVQLPFYFLLGALTGLLIHRSLRGRRIRAG